MTFDDATFDDFDDAESASTIRARLDNRNLDVDCDIDEVMSEVRKMTLPTTTSMLRLTTTEKNAKLMIMMMMRR